ncbi:MAG TPA: MFS transporter [Mycobacteriales bacterium]|nr:MFS transporter [Mycobacteriales bacterium]
MQEMGDDRANFREVLRIREFRALYLAQTLSVLGDQLARIAIAVIVFGRTSSATLTAVSYAVSYLPWIAGGPTLSSLADHLPRRTVMVCCDCSRALLIGVTALHNCPTAGLIGLVAAVAVLQPPFTAARAATIPEVVGEGAGYAAAATLTNATLQVAVLSGFALGGVVIAAIGTSATVLADALTFVISAMIVARFVQSRPPVAPEKSAWRADMRAGWTAVFQDHRLRRLVTISWIVVGASITTEAVAVPYAQAHGEGATTAGLLTASMPLGTAVGALILTRFESARLERALPHIATAALLALALTTANPTPPLAAAAWVFAGALSAITVFANRVFVVAVPREIRGRAFGVAAAGISGAQGIGTILVGLAASRLSPAHSVGMVICAWLLLLMVANAKRLGSRSVNFAKISPEPLTTPSATPSCDLSAS